MTLSARDWSSALENLARGVLDQRLYRLEQFFFLISRASLEPKKANGDRLLWDSESMYSYQVRYKV